MARIIIIGSGPAGFTAALYAARANLHPLVIAGSQYGGQLMLTTDVENYPGFEDGIQGPELMEKMKKQAEKFGAKIIFDDVINVNFLTRPFIINTDNKQYEADAVIISTGAAAKWLDIKSEIKFKGKGVSTCATCDGFFFKGKNVVVVGGGDSAMEESLFLSRLGNKVTIIHRRNNLRASKIMQERVFKNKQINFVWDSVIDEILGQDKVTGIKIKNIKTKEITEMPCDGIFVAIGHKPATDIFKGQITLNEKGYVVTKNSTQTNIAGIFVAGDVQDYKYRQAITAAADGCKAAMDLEKYIENLEN